MIDSQFNSGKRQQRTQRGVSLIEVLVVLVILVTGILTIIRLFPSGFFSIQSAGNAALADSLGAAAIQSGTQDANSLPDSILPGTLLTSASIAAQYSNYDPDDPNNLENARVVSNETVQVPSASNGQSVYVVNYGPVVMPADPAATVAQLPSYFTVNSPNWTAVAGNSLPSPITNGTTPIDLPQDTLVPGQERFMVDLTNHKIAVPYAAYASGISYGQKMVAVIVCFDGTNYSTYTKFLNVPPATPKDPTNDPYAPFGSDNLAYLPDTSSNYQGSWFDPTAAYQDSPAGTNPPSNLPWVAVTLYRPYNGVLTGGTFDNDPYEFKLLAANIGSGANPGAIGFNPKAATGSGAQAHKAQISYVVDSWSILREDHDIPALTGTGSTSVVRTTVPNLLLAGSPNPDNTINPGIAGSNASMVILDIDSGKILAPLPSTSTSYDPTNADKPINNEDLSGTSTDPAVINVSYSTGRLTFGSNAFGDYSPTTGIAPAHRIRIFYAADLNWTVAVQKAPSYFNRNTTAAPTDTTPLGANEYAYDPAQSLIYFARCNANKTVEIDGTYPSTSSTGVTTTKSFTTTVAISPVLNDVGASDVSVSLGLPAGAPVTFTAVRGLSSRAVVAWKERNQWKEHSVDAVLTRTP